MPENTRTSRSTDCAVCGIAHDEEIHEATLNIHAWFRHQVTQYFYEEVEAEPQVA